MKQKAHHSIVCTRIGFLLILLLLLQSNKINAQYGTDTVIVQEELEEAIAAPEEEQEKETVENFFRYKDYAPPFSVSERNLPPGYAKKLKEDDAFWYADAAPETKKTEPATYEGSKGTNEQNSKKRVEYDTKIDTTGFSKLLEQKEKEPAKKYESVSKNSNVQTVLWIIIIGGFIAILAWYLITNNIRFRKNKADEKPLNADEMPENIFAINYLSEVDKAVAQGNYRLAIRLQYLRMLKTMAERNIIHYKQDKTNLDYMMELQPTAYYQNFFRTTRHYEFAWYGNFPVNAETYTLVRRGYDDFEKQITG